MDSLWSTRARFDLKINPRLFEYDQDCGFRATDCVILLRVTESCSFSLPPYVVNVRRRSFGPKRLGTR